EARLAHFIGRFQTIDNLVAEEPASSGWRERLTTRLNHAIARRDNVQATRIDLVRAGLQIKPAQFFLIRLILALVGALLVSSLLRSAGTIPFLVGAVGGFAGCYMLALPYVSFRQRKRLDAFEKLFADGLDIMVGGLESGSSLTAAVELVSREMPAPLSSEFGRVVRDASLGMSYEDAFSGMYERVPSDDVGMLVSAISVQFRVGGNLAAVLRTLSETVRDRQRIRGDIKTLTAQQSMTGWIITGIPFFMVFMLLLINREYMSQIFQPGPQRIIAGIGVVMIVIGNLVIRRILRIRV
ncbi:MAG TPA: type II secretion system F family protein, partial [Nitrolancea sp.]|nr:type II secretion system F family protein [Nitrolancea sp.]